MDRIPWAEFSNGGQVTGPSNAFFYVFFSVGLGPNFPGDLNEIKLVWVYTYYCDVIDLSYFIFPLQMFYFRS